MESLKVNPEHWVLWLTSLTGTTEITGHKLFKEKTNAHSK